MALLARWNEGTMNNNVLQNHFHVRIQASSHVPLHCTLSQVSNSERPLASSRHVTFCEPAHTASNPPAFPIGPPSQKTPMKVTRQTEMKRPTFLPGIKSLYHSGTVSPSREKRIFINTTSLTPSFPPMEKEQVLNSDGMDDSSPSRQDELDSSTNSEGWSLKSSEGSSPDHETPGQVTSYYYRPPTPLCPSPSDSFRSCCHLRLDYKRPSFQRPTHHSSKLLQELLHRQSQRLSSLQCLVDQDQARISQLQMEVDYLQQSLDPQPCPKEDGDLALEDVLRLRKEIHHLEVECHYLAFQLEQLANEEENGSSTGRLYFH